MHSTTTSRISRFHALRRRRSRHEAGFTLIELLVVLMVIAVLIATAVPSYLGFKTRAEKSAAQSNVRSAVPAMEAYYSDNKTYVGATLAALRSIDTGLASVTVSALSPTTYTISFTRGQCSASVNGPGGQVTSNC